MENQNYCEFFGTLEKLEEFTTLTQNIVPGSLVYESLSPFWGYYNEDPKDYCPLYIYLIINRTHEIFDVIRSFQNVKSSLDFDLDVAKAFVKFNDRFYNALRVRHLNGYDHLQEIQEAFIKEGISPLIVNDNQKRVMAHVTLKKMFCLAPVNDDICLDACEDNHAYLVIPKRLTFDQFADLTIKVRNNWLESKFDAALGYFIKRGKIVDIIRIYTEKLDLEYLEGIRKLYLQKLK